MRSREVVNIDLRSVAGVCTLFVSLHGLWGAYGLDLRIDTAVAFLYCLLPVSSFFVFLFVRSPKIEVGLHCLVALGYWTTYAMLNQRTCTAFGDCGTIAATTSMTLTTQPVLALLR